MAAANWQCEEYGDMQPQFLYLIAERPAVVRVAMAYIDLHSTIWAVTPTLHCITKAMKQHGGGAQTAPQMIKIENNDFYRMFCDLKQTCMK